MPTATKPRPANTTNVFESAVKKVYPFRYDGELLVTSLTGGIPSNPRVIEGWLRNKLKVGGEHAAAAAILEEVAKVAEQRQITNEGEAIEEYLKSANVNGFKQVVVSPHKSPVLCVEGRQVKAAIKEAFNVALGAGNVPKGQIWGETKKGLTSFVAEHIIVAERFIPILHEDGTPFTTPTGVEQRFVHTFRGSSISYEEYCDPAVLRFTVLADWDFEDHWPSVWTTGGNQGIGAVRSQGRGVYVVTQWDKQKR